MKRTKLFTGLIMCCICLSLLVVGVWAATTTSFTLNGNLMYYPEGVYISLDGQVYVGNSAEDLKPLKGGTYTYSASNFEYNDGEPSGNIPMNSWNVGNLNFTTQAKYIKIELNMTNHSDFEVIGYPTLTGNATSNSNITITNPGYIFAYVGESGTYELVLELNETAGQISGQNIDVNFRFEQAVADYTLFTYDTGGSSTATQITGLNTTNYTSTTAPETLIIPSYNESGTLMTIADYCFVDVEAGVTKLDSKTKNVVSLRGLQSIGDGLFAVSGLHKINIPSTVTSIGTAAFGSSTSLTNIIIPNGVISIGGAAFMDCTSLTNITIPNSVTSINSNLFSNCTALKTVTFEDNSNITSIGYSAFSSCSSLISINIPKSVTSIDGSAFGGCSSLTSINIPKSVTSIGRLAFSKCISLSSMTLPSDLTSIGEFAFSECILLSSITIPSNVTSIGANAFELINLTEVIIDSPTIFESLTNSTICGHLIKNATTIRINKYLLDAGYTNSYIDSNYSRSTSPQGDYYVYTKINSEYLYFTFENSTGESSDALNGTVISGLSQNYYSSAPTTLTIPDVNQSGQALTIKDGTSTVFDLSTTTKNVVISDGITKIGDHAFDSTALTSVTLSNDLQSIGMYAFKNCNLTSITITENVQSIEEGAFAGCSKLTDVIINSSTIVGQANSPTACGSLLYSPVTIKISDSLSSVANSNSYLISLYIKDSVVQNGYYVYERNTSYYDYFTYETSTGASSNSTSGIVISGLSSVYTNSPPTTLYIPGVNKNGQALSIKDNSTLGLVSTTTSIVILNGLKEIGNSAFSWKSFLTSVIIPNTVTRIGDEAFYGVAITNIDIPDSVKSIGYQAFRGCTALQSIRLGSGLTTLGASVFHECTKLKSVVIPNSVTSIGNGLFEGCEALTSVKLPDGLQSIGDYMFKACDNLSSITIPSNVKTIGSNAFEGCISLTSITIPSSVTTIGDYAFNSCRKLKSITIPASVTKIGKGAFISCNALTSLIFSDTTTWYATTNSGYTGGTSISVSSSSTNLTNFKTTYKSYYWYKV